MYLKTPKRYSTKGRKPNLFSTGRLLVWLIVPPLIWGGWWVYQQREQFTPMVSETVDGLYQNSSSMVATLTAPTPMPTENPANILNRAEASWFAGRVEDALVEYERATSLVPNDVLTHYNLAMGLIVEGQDAQALEAAEAAVTANPYSADAWAIRALAQTRNGNHGGALASARQALLLNPNNARAHAFLTEAYLALQQFERARESANRALEIDPNLAEGYYARALVRQQVDFDREAAREDFVTAYDLAPYLTDAAVDLAYIDYALYLNGAIPNLDSALVTLNSVKDANPNNTTALYALGFVYFAGLGDPNSAADNLARCVNVAPDNAECQYYYGRVLISLEQYQNAADRLVQAVQLSTAAGNPNPRYNYWAGEALIYLGNCSQALVYLQPGFQLARDRNDSDLATSLQTSIRECGGFEGVPASPTETAPLDGDAPLTEGDDATEETAEDTSADESITPSPQPTPNA